MCRKFRIYVACGRGGSVIFFEESYKTLVDLEFILEITGGSQ
jgi:hypothetical protein